MTWYAFSAVPGLSVPGLANPARPGTAGTAPTQTTWTYIGHIPVYYLDYLDTVTHETLAVVPNGSYAMVPVNSRAGLTIPPPDDCWLTATNRWAPRAVFRPAAQPQGSARHAPRVTAPPSRAALELAAARRVNAERQARVRRETVGH